MAFWTQTGNNAIHPKRKDLFVVEMSSLGDGVIWPVKAIDKPTIKFETQVGNAGSYIAGSNLAVPIQNMGGIQAFEDIKITFVDPDAATGVLPITEDLTRIVDAMAPTGSPIAKIIQTQTKALGSVIIRQLSHKNSQGRNELTTDETWELFNPYVTSIDYSSLSYEEGGLLELTLTVGYTGFQVTFGNGTVHEFGNRTILKTIATT